MRAARILRRVLETWGDLLSLKLQWQTISVSLCENSNNNNRYLQSLENIPLFFSRNAFLKVKCIQVFIKNKINLHVSKIIKR